jgi:hypothetical protein
MLLEAIRKLEHGVAVKSPHQVSDELAAELQSLSDAIGAMLAGDREASEDDVRSAIEQLSEVKRRIDGLIADRSGDDAADGALTARNLRYFRDDEDLFVAMPLITADADQEGDRAAPAAAEASAAIASPKDRLVFIHRASSRETSIPLADEAPDLAPASQSQPGS